MKGEFVDVCRGLGQLKATQREPIHCTGLMCPGQLLICKGREGEGRILAFLSTREELTMWMQSFVVGECSPCMWNPSDQMYEIQKHLLTPSGVRLLQRPP